MGGIWAFVLDRASARANGLYSVRASVDSVWKVGRKKGWWKGIQGGDLCVLVLAMAVTGVVFERDPRALGGTVVRWLVRGLRGQQEEKEEKEEKDEEERRGSSFKGRGGG